MPLAQEGAELLAKHQDGAVEFLAKHQEDGAQVSRYVQNVVDVDLANLDLEQGYQVSRLAQEFEIPIAITGRWADTQAEAAIRAEAKAMMDDLIAQGIDENIARLRAADAFGINPHQVKVSAGKQEVDVFIPKDVWDNMSDWQRQRIEEQLPSIFGVSEIDFYQNISPDKVLPGWPDPRTNIPPGSIIFHPDGQIIHNLIGK